MNLTPAEEKIVAYALQTAAAHWRKEACGPSIERPEFDYWRKCLEDQAADAERLHTKLRNHEQQVSE
jgi:hypothetical protein